MKIAAILSLALLVGISSVRVLGVDFKADPTFVSSLPFNHIIHELLVLPGGDILVAGEINLTGATTAPFVKRLNSDGSIDTSFTLSSTITGGLGGDGKVTVIRALPNGQYVIAGSMYIGPTHGHFARLNSDGSLDTTLTSSSTSFVRTAQSDGKLIACNPDHTVNSENYKVAHRLNSDGTFDPTFRITWADGGFCESVHVLSDGRMLITGAFTNGGTPLKRLQRINTDGSLDASFNAAVPEGSGVGNVRVLPDGKLMIRNGLTSRRLFPDGSLDLIFENCQGGFAELDGDNYLMGGCKKWPSGPEFPILRVSPSGVVDGTMDRLTIGALSGVRNAGPNTFYLFGVFTGYGGVNSPRILRIIPETAPPKAPFDFDGDGKSDIAVYRPSNFTWYLNQSSAGAQYIPWGLSGDKVVAADANLDGKTDIGVFRNGAWHGYSYLTGTHHYMCLGEGADKPMILFPNQGEEARGDRFAVRGTRNGSLWWLVAGSRYFSCWIQPSQSTPLSLAGEGASDIPVTGDFNGDSIAEAGYFRDGYWSSADVEKLQAPAAYHWGAPGDIPVPGDYDGDRQTDYAVYRPSTGQWWMNRTTNGVVVVQFGLGSDIPVPADYDGDGKTDIAIYRDGYWWQYLSATGSINVHQWGLPGDVPIPAQSRF